MHPSTDIRTLDVAEGEGMRLGHLQVATRWPVRLATRRAILNTDLSEDGPSWFAGQHDLDDADGGVEVAERVHLVKFVARARIPEIAVIHDSIDHGRGIAGFHVPHQHVPNVEDRAEAG